MKFEFKPQGPFDLAYQNQFFGGWLTPRDDPASIVMAFPVEGWQGSAAITLRQTAESTLQGEVYGGDPGLFEKARDQALACLSLDVDGSAWPEVGQRDEVLGALQSRYKFLRPVLFHSPYEAAAGFIIGHRISIKQRQTIMARMAEQLGEALQVGGQTFHAFPIPQVLLTLGNYPGLNEQKIERLRAVAQAALDGWLDRAALRALPAENALTRLETLPGVGPFFSQGILNRGAGLVDEITHDDMTQYAFQTAYHLPELPDRAEMARIAGAWRPYRMWVTVLLHVWVRREVGTFGKQRTFSK